MIDLSLTSAPPLDADADLLVIACAERDLEAGGLLEQADARAGGILRRAIDEERFRARTGQTLVAHVHGLRVRRVALVGLGNQSAPVTSAHAAARALRTAAGVAVRVATSAGAERAAFAWSTPPRPDASTALVESAAEGLLLGGYRFGKYWTDERSRPPSLAAVALAAAPSADNERALDRARITARAVARARDLVNEPAGALTPKALAAVASSWAAETPGVALQVLDRAACEQIGMGLFLAVARGSAEEPRFIHLSWTPPDPRRRIVLVGKGVTFDSGGLSLKTTEGMLDMKTDMAGAAAVLAATAAIAEERLPVEVHALAACTENMPSGTSYKLGDVIRSLAGKTVEINNTDAEGRLTLADAVSYGLRLQPDALLDFATLTGACMVALGPHMAGVMSNDDELAQAFLAAADAAGEDVWRLPLPPRLADQLKSEIADMKNTGERWGGALTAGLFLKEFVGSTPWVHVDIAGPASASKDYGHAPRGATGFAVASILGYVRRAAGL